MTSCILSKAHVVAQVKALEKVGAIIEKSKTGYVVKAPTAQQQEIYRAMIGTRGTYLVRHADNLFAGA